MCLEKQTYPQKNIFNEVVHISEAVAKHEHAQELESSKSLFYMHKIDLSTVDGDAYLLLLIDIPGFG